MKSLCAAFLTSVLLIGLALALLSAAPVVAQDTLTIVADAFPIWGSAPELVEEMRIGVLDGDVDFAFGHLVGLAVEKDGTIWVADSQNIEVKRFSSKGKFLGLVASRGEGPGELGGVSGIKLLPDGRIAVFDAHRGRIDFFLSDGSFDSSVTRSDPMHIVEKRSPDVKFTHPQASTVKSPFRSQDRDP